MAEPTLVPFVPQPRSGSKIGAVLIASLGLNAVLLAAGVARDRSVAPVHIAAVAPAPPVVLARAPAPAPALARDCTISEAPADPSAWTIGADHVGPFHACDPRLADLAAVRAMVPDMTVTRTENDDGVAELRVRRGDAALLTIRGFEHGPRIAILARSIATPWRVRVGDRVGKLRDRARDLTCVYGAAEGGESLACFRSGDGGDGWVDGLVYALDPHQLTGAQRRTLASDEPLPIATFDRFVIQAVHWDSSHPEPL